MTVVSEFVASLGVRPDTASFAKSESMLSTLGSKAGQVASVFGALFAGKELVNFFKGIVHQGDQLNDLILKTGISGQSLQALGLAAEQNGSSLEELAGGLKFLQRNSEAAANGSKELAKTFTALGYSGAQLKAGVPTEELLGALANRMKSITDPAKRTALAMQVLGRSGAALVPFLAQGEEGLEKLKARFAELGGGLTDEFIKQADEVNDQLAEMRVATTSLSSVLGSALIPVITSIVTKLTGWAIAFSQLIKGNEFLQIALALTTAAFVAWGVALLWASESARAKGGILFTIGLLAAGLDEIRTALRGGKSLLGQFIDKSLGLGTTDRWVRSIGQGWQVILDVLHEINSMTPSEFMKKIVWFVRDAKEALEKTNKQAGVQGQIAAAREASGSSDPFLAAAGKRRLAQLESDNYGSTESTPRALWRGMTAASEQVVAGRASASAVNEGLKGAPALFGSGEARIRSDLDQRTVIVQQKAEVNVKAETNADPKAIGHHVKRAVKEAFDEKADHIRRNYGRRQQSVDAEPVGGDSDLEGVDEE